MSAPGVALSALDFQFSDVQVGRDAIMAQELHLHLPPEALAANARQYLVTRGVYPYQDLMHGLEAVNLDFVGEIDVATLRVKLLQLAHGLREPKLITVRGTLYPGVLMTCGWWERANQANKLDKLHWQDGLQEWLFNGFDLWGPSWDFTWNLEAGDQIMGQSYHVAQLGDGDEANSIPVVIPEDKAQKLRALFLETWGGLEVCITGLLGHRRQFAKNTAPLQLFGGLLDYCLWLNPEDKNHKISALANQTTLYSGYLWKCVVPQKWLQPGHAPRLNQVYFLWEHTNFAKPDAIRYSLDSLDYKEHYLSHLHGPLVLVQKSSHVVPGVPAWSSQTIYNLLTGKTGEDI